MIIRRTERNVQKLRMLKDIISGLEMSVSLNSFSFDETVGVPFILNGKLPATYVINEYFEGDIEVFRIFLAALFDDECDMHITDIPNSLWGLVEGAFSWSRVDEKYGVDFQKYARKIYMKV